MKRKIISVLLCSMLITSTVSAAEINHWAEKEITYCIENNIADLSDAPNENVTAEVFSAAISKAFKTEYTENGNITRGTAVYAITAVSDAKQNDIAKGYTDGSVRLENNITKAELAVMIYRALNVNKYSAGVTVLEDNNSVTGYTVRFVYDNANADNVNLYGSFAFFDKENYLEPVTPYEYKEGMFTVNFGLETNGKDTIPMNKIDGTSLWTVDVPMPKGQYNYLYQVTENGETKNIPDPANDVITNPITGITSGRSLFYVGNGYDTADVLTAVFPTEGEKGTIKFDEYKDINGDKQGLVIYLPVGYDPERAEPYKVFYLSHGGGGDEMGYRFMTGADNIMDNLIADGKTEPAILVSMNNQNYSWDYNVIAENFKKAIIPYMESNYNVSVKTEDRAYAGVSMGGITGSMLLSYYTDLFGYYGIFSGSNASVIKNGNDSFAPADMETVKNMGAKIYLAQGYLDISNKRLNDSYKTDNDITLDGLADYLTENGIAYTYYEADGGHDQPCGGKILSRFVSEFLWE